MTDGMNYPLHKFQYVLKTVFLISVFLKLRTNISHDLVLLLITTEFFCWKGLFVAV